MSFLAALMVGATLWATTPDTQKETVKVDASTSTIEWVGYKVTGKHNGTIQVQSGALMFEEGVLVGGNFTIDMASIKCTDLEGDYAGKLEGHLKSDDFFGVEAHPTASFEIIKAVPYGTNGDYKVVGNLTIKEITKEIKFTANVTAEAAAAEMEIDRSDFNVKYGSGSFFDNLGDKTIYDEFDLKVMLALVKA